MAGQHGDGAGGLGPDGLPGQPYEPGIGRFGLTVTPGGETAWLDHPGNPVGA